jgi:hypothetical protein
MGIYTERDEFRSGKHLKEMVKSGVKVKVYQPGPFGPTVKDGYDVVEFPQFPKPHRYYVGVIVKDGVIEKVK